MKKLMTRKLLLALFLIMIVSLVSAQESSKQDKPARIGIRAGWSYSAMFDNNVQLAGTDYMSSFYIGIFKEKKLVPLLRLGSGIEYVKNGYKITNDLTRDIHYLSVPLYLKFKIGPVYATGGTGFNFKVSEELPGSTLLDPLKNKSTNFFDMPLQLGAGLKILMFSVEARYNWGMFNVNGDASNQYLQVGFTVSF